MTDRELMQQALEALEEIALAGMSVAPEMLDEKEAFHARQAWRFIGIAARALESVKKARAEQPERHELQAKGEHPAPCARHCEANAFQIVIKNLQAQLAQPEQEPNYWLGYGLQAHTEKPFEGATPLYTAQPQGIYYTPPQRKPLPPQSPCEMTQAERKMFRLGWLECEAAHGIKGEA